MDCVNILVSQKAMKIYNEYLKDPKYKTEMCKNWEKYQNCPYNAKCRYAHGKEELMKKEAEANPNYKAKDCFNFFKYGYCNYGRRCCFKHDDRAINEKNSETEALILLSLKKPSGNSRLSVFSDIKLEEEAVEEVEINYRSSKKSYKSTKSNKSKHSSTYKQQRTISSYKSTKSTQYSQKQSKSKEKDSSLNSTRDDILDTLSSEYCEC